MADDEFAYDAANEGIVISAAIASDSKSRRILVHSLSADEFLVPRHAVIWKSLRNVVDAGLTPTVDVLRRYVTDEGGDSAAVDQVEELASDAKAPTNIKWHVETMQWDATRARVVQGIVPELIKSLNDPKSKESDVVPLARRTLRALQGAARKYIHRPSVLYREYRAEIAARRVHRNIYPLGNEAFDSKLTSGFAPGHITVTAGLPGAGKTTVWLAFAILLAKLGRRVTYCAWEMSAESLLDVAISHMTGIKLRDIVHGTLTDEETHRVDQCAAWITKRIRFMGNPFQGSTGDGKKPSNDRNLDKLEGYLAESPSDVVIYDLWERMLRWRSPDDVTDALFRLQWMHEEYGIHGVVVHQLRLKDVEARPDRRPTREAIKGTGAYVEVADLIIGIHREAQFKAVDDTTCETICLKQRKGESNWSVRWQWDGATCQVRDGEEIPFDPGLEAAVEAGDIGRSVKDVKDIKSGKSKGGRRRRIGRREQ